MLGPAQRAQRDARLLQGPADRRLGGLRHRGVELPDRARAGVAHPLQAAALRAHGALELDHLLRRHRPLRQRLDARQFSRLEARCALGHRVVPSARSLAVDHGPEGLDLLQGRPL